MATIVCGNSDALEMTVGVLLEFILAEIVVVRILVGRLFLSSHNIACGCEKRSSDHHDCNNSIHKL